MGVASSFWHSHTLTAIEEIGEAQREIKREMPDANMELSAKQFNSHMGLSAELHQSKMDLKAHYWVVERLMQRHSTTSRGTSHPRSIRRGWGSERTSMQLKGASRRRWRR